MPFDPRHPQWVGFIDKIKADPRCDTARLVACDWLEENHPGFGLHDLWRGMIDVNKRHPFLMLGFNGWDQPARATQGCLQARRAEWALKRTWLLWHPIPSLGREIARWRWHRGTLARVCVEWQVWARYWHELLAYGPIAEVELLSRPTITREYGVSLDRYKLASPMIGRSSAASSVVIVDRIMWDQAHVNAQWRMRDAMIEELLGQVWPRDEVGRFNIDDEALTRRDDGADQ